MGRLSKEEVRANWYQVKHQLSMTQPRCPACNGLLNRLGDGHHLFFRRKKGDLRFDVPINVILVDHACHVPEAEGLNFKCAKMKLQEYGPEAIEAWADQIGRPLPSYYWDAKDCLYG